MKFFSMIFGLTALLASTTAALPTPQYSAVTDSITATDLAKSDLTARGWGETNAGIAQNQCCHIYREQCPDGAVQAIQYGDEQDNELANEAMGKCARPYDHYCRERTIKGKEREPEFCKLEHMKGW